MEEKELIRQDEDARANALSMASHKLLLNVSDFLRKCYLTAIPATRFVDFLCAVCCKQTVTRNVGGKTVIKTYPPILDRVELVKKKICAPEVQEQLDKLNFTELNEMANDDFCGLLRKGIPAAPEEDLRRRLIGMADLAALFKMNTILKDIDPSLDFFGMLSQHFPRLKNIGQENWEKMNGKAINLRNRWGGHVNGETFRTADTDLCMTAGRWRAASSAWLKVAEPLRNEETEPYYQQIIAACEEAQVRMRCRLVPLQELAEESGGFTAEQVRKILTESYRYTCSGETVFCNTDEALSCLRDYARQQNMQQTLQALQQELAQMKAAPGNGEQLLKSYILRQSGGASMDLLVSYRGGNMDRRTVQQLVETHKIVLDTTLLKRREGRQFIMEDLRPALQRCGQNLNTSLLVEATAMYHLMKGYMEFQSIGKKLRTMVPTPVNRAERERMQARREELTGTKAAYLFVRDELRLVPTGIPDPLLDDEEALVEFLQDHPLERICVLTCGATGLVKRIQRDRTPLVRIGRVRSAGEAIACNIFSQFLPFEQSPEQEAGLKQIFARMEDSLTEEPDAAEPEPAKQPEPGKQPEPAKQPAVPQQKRAVPAPPAPKPAEPAQKTPSVHHATQAFAADLPLRTMDETLLPLHAQPHTGDRLRTEEGTDVKLDSPLMEGGEEAQGGEGAVYVTDIPGQVAKIYFADHLTVGRRDKLTEMLSHDPGLEGLCWPTHILYNTAGEFVGYTMLQAPENAMPFSKSVLKIGSPSQRKAYMSSWTRSDLVRAARGVAKILAGLHRKNILMGDVNAGNFMVDLKDSSRVYAVDTDSFQLGGYPCPVGFEDFTHPGTAARLGVSGGLRFGTFLRTQEEEEYALAILLFEILFLGANPFVTKSEMTYLEAMRTKNFPYANTGDEWTVPDGDNWMIWKNLPRKITDAFTATFVQWKTTSAQNWVQLMDDYLFRIGHYNFSNELAPVKYHEFHPEDPIYVDVHCAYCRKEFNMHKRRYADLTRGKRPILCRECSNFLSLHRDEPYPQPLKCSKCGRQYQATVGDAFYMEAGIEPALCSDCRNPETVCEGCGQKFRMPYKQLEELKSKKIPVVCKDCRGSEMVTCPSCGKLYQEKTWKVRRNKRLGHVLRCEDCRKQVKEACAVCGRDYWTPRWRVLKNQENNWPGLCENCRNQEYVTVSCDSCGSDVTVPLRVFNGRWHNNQKILCDSCYRKSFR